MVATNDEEHAIKASYQLTDQVIRPQMEGYIDRKDRNISESSY